MSEFDSYRLSPVQKLRVSVALMLMVVTFGTVGFMYLEGMGPLDGLYMTVITLSTVGYGEVTPLDATGRLFAIVLIVLGVGLAAFTASVIAQIALEGQLREIVERRKMDKKLKGLSGHYVVAGYGRVGRQVANHFRNRKVTFVVIENNTDILESLTSDGTLVVRGDATEEEVLTKASIETAHTLITTLPDEAHNLYLTLTARDMNRKLRIIARADLEQGEKKLRRAGADQVISPHVIGGDRMAMAALRPHVVDFMHMATLADGGLSIEEIVVPEGCKFVGKTILESQLTMEYGVTVIGVKPAQGQMAVIPGPNTQLDAGDSLVLIGPVDDLDRLNKVLG